jgi:hypothetical protein
MIKSNEELKQEIIGHIAYSTRVTHNLADALIYIEELHSSIAEQGQRIEEKIQWSMSDTDFNYERSAESCVSSNEEALCNVQADAILSVNTYWDALGINYDIAHQIDRADVVTYADRVRKGVK